jgi:putative mycofactocin binding protein MftB
VGAGPAFVACLEASGAVSYHRGDHRQTLIKAADLPAVVSELATSTDVQGALAGAGVPRVERGVHLRSLRRMADAGMLRRRPEDGR